MSVRLAFPRFGVNHLPGPLTHALALPGHAETVPVPQGPGLGFAVIATILMMITIALINLVMKPVFLAVLVALRTAIWMMLAAVLVGGVMVVFVIALLR